MVGVDVAGFDAGVDSDVSFAELLMEEECVFVLPGQVPPPPPAACLPACLPPTCLSCLAD